MPDDLSHLDPGIYLAPSAGWDGAPQLFAQLPGTAGKCYSIESLEGAITQEQVNPPDLALSVQELSSRAWLREIDVAPPADPVTRRSVSFYAGGLLGGAVGDALGAMVPHTPVATLRRHYSLATGGRTPAYGPLLPTWYTQLTLFTTEGLMRAYNRGMAKGIGGGAPGCIYHAYLRWMYTQGERPATLTDDKLDGWLIAEQPRFPRRNPSKTTITALSADSPGSPERPVNQSKGCGALPRAIAVGLAEERLAFDPFDLGMAAAALTHGHPTALLAAGFLATLTAALMAGGTLSTATDIAMARLRRQPQHEACEARLKTAIVLAHEPTATREGVNRLGQGFTADEALAISLFCAMRAEDFEHGVLLSVDHDGERSATGAITGAILGVLFGRGAIPGRWLEYLELRPIIDDLARDMFCHFGHPDYAHYVARDWSRYPGW